jgi:hypothetical protein
MKLFLNLKIKLFVMLIKSEFLKNVKRRISAFNIKIIFIFSIKIRNIFINTLIVNYLIYLIEFEFLNKS